ncbi:hypothetical protein M5689_011730 [Euphorbia peplus]|nr:hypothetical protein M5689_011730 [Euphorbia peplus]
MSWVRVNSDGAMKGYSLCASGVIDHDSIWLAGYARNIGNCRITKAKLWGVLEGLSQAWGVVSKSVELELDSKAA